MSTESKSLVGRWFAALLAGAFLWIGLRLALMSPSGLPKMEEATLHFARLFGVRDAFLGALVLVFLVARERRAAFLLMASAIALPLVDIAVLAPLAGLSSAVRANLPFEIPLILATILLAPRRASATKVDEEKV